MNDRDERIEDIERDEAWLAEYATPDPPPLVIERVKHVVRAACRECQDEAPEIRIAMAAAKDAVRRELLTQRVARRSAWRLVTPILAVAAAVAFGAFRLAMDRPQSPAGDATFAGFVETIAEAPSDLDLSLSELDRDLSDLADDGYAMSRAEWTTHWIDDNVGENLDTLADALEQLEKM